MNHEVEAGQVWEGQDGWIVLILEADEPESDSPWLVHKVRTILAPEGAAAPCHPETIVEDLRYNGLPGAGWKRLF